MFTPNVTNPSETSDFFLDNFHAMHDEHIFQIGLRYPLEETNSFPNKAPYFSSAAAALGDVYFVCPALALSTAVSRYTHSWNYRFLPLTHAIFIAI